MRRSLDRYGLEKKLDPRENPLSTSRRFAMLRKGYKKVSYIVFAIN